VVSDGTESNEGSNLSPNPPRDSADQCKETGSTAGSTDESAAGEDNEECPQKECVKLQKLCDKYQQGNAKLRKKVFDDEFLADEDSKTNYYTGLPSYEFLQVIFC